MDSMMKLIRQYEPLMHKLLKDIPTRNNYEDYLQELRIVTWQTIKTYDKTKETKLETLLYQALKNKIQDLLRTGGYLLRKNNPCTNCSRVAVCTKDCAEKGKLLYELQKKRAVKYPIKYGEFNCQDRMKELGTSKDMEDMHYRLLTENILKTLKGIDKKIVVQRLAGKNQAEISKELKVSQPYICKRLKKLQLKITKIIKRGA